MYADNLDLLGDWEMEICNNTKIIIGIVNEVLMKAATGKEPKLYKRSYENRY